MTSIRRPLFLACFMYLLAAPAFAADDDRARLDALLKNSPPDVVALVGRRLECQHWGGEEPYDAARRAEILAAVTHLKCGTLGADEEVLRRKYAQSPPVLVVLDAARALE